MIMNKKEFAWKNIYSKDVIADVVERSVNLGKIPALCMNGSRLTQNGILTEMKNIDSVLLRDNAYKYILSEAVKKSGLPQFDGEFSESVEVLEYLIRNSVCVLQTCKDIYVLSGCDDILRLLCTVSTGSAFATVNFISCICLSKNGKHIGKPVNLTLDEPYVVYPLDGVVEYIYSIIDKLANNMGVITTINPANNKRSIYFITSCEKFYDELGFIEQLSKSQEFFPLNFKGTFRFRTISANGGKRIVFPITQIEKMIFPD